MSNFRTITAKIESHCQRCDETVPVGTRVRWLKGRGIWHLAAECPGSDAYVGDAAEVDAIAAAEARVGA